MDKLHVGFDLSRKVKSRFSDTALITLGSRRGKSGRAEAKSKNMGKEQDSSIGDDSARSATTSRKKVVIFPVT